MTPLQYLSKEIGLGELSKLPATDRDTLKSWAAEEMKALGLDISATA